jgi:hypothetical protein
MGAPVGDSPECQHGPTHATPLWLRLAPLLLVLGLAPWIYVAVPHYLDQPLNGDTGIFQYVAWCIRRGERLYDTIAMPDGPFVYLLHIPIQRLFGLSERSFRTADVGIHVVVAAAMGGVLAGTTRQRSDALGRAVWALAAGSIWLSYLFVLDWYASAQRDAYYALFGSLGLVLAYAAPAHAGRRRTAALFFAGFVPALVTFGKHSGVLYLGLAAISVLLGAAPPGELPRRRVTVFVVGAASGIVAILGFVALFGSLRGLWFWYFVYPLRVYRYLFAQPLAAMLGSPGLRPFYYLGATATVGGLAAVGLRLLPARALGLSAAPALQIIAFLLQRKGWAYQCHPVLAGAHLVFLLGLVTIWSDEAGRRRSLPWLALLFVYARCLEELEASPWLPEAPRMNVSLREKVAAYVSEHTKPEDRVFYFGIDPYTLLLALRRPAVPYPVSFVLDFKPALDPPTSLRDAGPDAAARARVVELQPRVADDACARLVTSPPAALVFTSIPPNTSTDPIGDVTRLCPALEALLRARYRSGMTVERTGVYLRSDLE